MKTISNPEWARAIPDAPPTYDYDTITCPSGIDLRFIAIRHHTDGGSPDYMRETLRQTDIFVPELPCWVPETAKLIRRVANGDLNARQRMDMNALPTKAVDPGSWAYNQTVFKALFDSKVGVAFVDYQPGLAFNNMNLAFATADDGSEVWPYHKKREQFILRGLSKAIDEARSFVRRPHDPLRVTMTYGALHMGMADALQEAANRQGSEIEVSLEFEDSMADGNSVEATQEMLGDVIDYQTWLRTQ